MGKLTDRWAQEKVWKETQTRAFYASPLMSGRKKAAAEVVGMLLVAPPWPFLYITHSLITYKSISKRQWRGNKDEAGEVVAIATHGGCKLWGPKGQLPDQRPAAMQEYRGVHEGPTAGSLLRQTDVVFIVLGSQSYPVRDGCCKAHRVLYFSLIFLKLTALIPTWIFS